ncbi:MAG TPA: hypothetical protein VL171_07295 [Verrucomicrobiae bacterium]|nr:hypothetical protein [Verrucomicrobiae bacterium]
MNPLRSIIAFLSLVALFFGTVFPLAVHLLFGGPGYTVWDILVAAAFAIYFLGCFLSCLSFLRGTALLSVALGIHLLVAVVLFVGLSKSLGASIGIIMLPVWLLFMLLYGLMVWQRMRKVIG